jgi:O-antigen/teichoic acid export membrane protein
MPESVDLSPAGMPKGAFATLSMRVTHVALEFLVLMLLARLLDKSAFGVYAVAMTCVALLGVPSAAGFDRLLVREVAANYAAERWALLRGVLRRATQVGLASSTLLALGLVAVAACVVRDRALSHAMMVAAMYLPLVVFARMRQAAMQGLGRVPQGMITETLVQPGTMLLLAATVFAVGGPSRSGANAVALQVASAVVAMLASIWLLRQFWPAPARSVGCEYQTSRWLGRAAPPIWMIC